MTTTKGAQPSLIITNMQSKTMRFPSTPAGTGSIKTLRQHGGKMWGKGNPCALLMGMYTTATMKTSMELLQKVKYKTTTGSYHLISGYRPKGN